MAENTTLDENGLLACSPSVLQDIHPTEDDIFNLDEEEEITSAQKQRSTDRQNERPPKPPRKRQHDPHGTHERTVPKKIPRRIIVQMQETIEDVEAKIKKSEGSKAKLQTHRDNNTCPKTLRYNARANIAPDKEKKNI